MTRCSPITDASSPNGDTTPATVRYYGVHARQAPGCMTEIDELAAAVGKTPNMVMFFSKLPQEYPQRKIDAAWERGMVPVLTLEPWLAGGRSVAQPTLLELTGTAWDTYFEGWAVRAREHGRRLVLRFAHEMNGDWYPWSERAAGNRRGDFVRMWRHVHDIFGSCGATNVVWCWSVTRVDRLPKPGRTIKALYPGDRYVDWVGMSAYWRPDAGAPPGFVPTFDATFGRTLAALRSVGSRAVQRPVLIGETGTLADEPARGRWTENVFAGLRDHPEIVGFVWFDDVALGTGNDWRVRRVGEQRAAFAAGVADPRYGAGLPRATTPS